MSENFKHHPGSGTHEIELRIGNGETVLTK